MGLLDKIQKGAQWIKKEAVDAAYEHAPAVAEGALDILAVREYVPSLLHNHLINPVLIPQLDHLLQTVPADTRAAVWATTDAQLLHAVASRPRLWGNGGVSAERTGNEITTLVDGVAYKEALLKQIRYPANKTIWIETYEWQDETTTGIEIANALIAAKKANPKLEIKVLYDNRSTFNELQHIKRPATATLPKLMQDMQTAGIEVKHTDYSALRVNHRKLAVFNGETMFMGGQNIGDSYMTAAYYHDLTQRIVGPSAADGAAVFADSWFRAGGARLKVPDPAPARGGFGSGAKVRVISHSGGIDRNIERELIARIDGERSGGEVVLTNGFGMSEAIANALKRAVARGAKVTWIWGKAAHMPALMAEQKFAELIKAGVEIRKYPGDLHMKTAYFKNADTIIQGSSNLDGFSTLVNDEAVVQISGGGVAADFYKTVVAPDLAKSPKTTTTGEKAVDRDEDLKARLAEAIVDNDD